MFLQYPKGEDGSEELLSRHVAAILAAVPMLLVLFSFQRATYNVVKTMHQAQAGINVRGMHVDRAFFGAENVVSASCEGAVGVLGHLAGRTWEVPSTWQDVEQQRLKEMGGNQALSDPLAQKAVATESSDGSDAAANCLKFDENMRVWRPTQTRWSERKHGRRPAGGSQEAENVGAAQRCCFTGVGATAGRRMCDWFVLDLGGVVDDVKKFCLRNISENDKSTRRFRIEVSENQKTWTTAVADGQLRPGSDVEQFVKNDALGTFFSVKVRYVRLTVLETAPAGGGLLHFDAVRGSAAQKWSSDLLVLDPEVARGVAPIVIPDPYVYERAVMARCMISLRLLRIGQQELPRSSSCSKCLLSQNVAERDNLVLMDVPKTDLNNNDTSRWRPNSKAPVNGAWMMSDAADMQSKMGNLGVLKIVLCRKGFRFAGRSVVPALDTHADKAARGLHQFDAEAKHLSRLLKSFTNGGADGQARTMSEKWRSRTLAMTEDMHKVHSKDDDVPTRVKLWRTSLDEHGLGLSPDRSKHLAHPERVLKEDLCWHARRTLAESNLVHHFGAVLRPLALDRRRSNDGLHSSRVDCEFVVTKLSAGTKALKSAIKSVSGFYSSTELNQEWQQQLDDPTRTTVFTRWCGTGSDVPLHVQSGRDLDEHAEGEVPILCNGKLVTSGHAIVQSTNREGATFQRRIVWCEQGQTLAEVVQSAGVVGTTRQVLFVVASVKFEGNYVPNHKVDEMLQRAGCAQAEVPILVNGKPVPTGHVIASASASASSESSKSRRCENAFISNDEQWGTTNEGAGAGSWTQSNFGAHHTVNRFEYQQRRGQENNKKITLSFSDGSSQSFTLVEGYSLQFFPVDEVHTTFVKITVDSVYQTSNNGATRIAFYTDFDPLVEQQRKQTSSTGNKDGNEARTEDHAHQHHDSSHAGYAHERTTFLGADCKMKGPHAGKYLSDYAADGGKKHTSLAAAQAACLADPTAHGVTGDKGGTFTVRKGNALKSSPDGETSWVKRKGAGPDPDLDSEMFLCVDFEDAQPYVVFLDAPGNELWLRQKLAGVFSADDAAAASDPTVSQEVAEDKKAHDAVLLHAILPTETSYVGGQANDLKVSQGGRSGCRFHARINSDPKTSNSLHGDVNYRSTMRERDWQHSLVVSQIHQRIFGTSYLSGNQNEWVDDMWDKQRRQGAQEYVKQVRESLAN